MTYIVKAVGHAEPKAKYLKMIDILNILHITAIYII